MVDLGKKVGPLPLGGWILIGGGTLGLILLLHKKSSSSGTKLTPEQEGNEAKRQQLEEWLQGMENASAGGGAGIGSEAGQHEVNTPFNPSEIKAAVEEGVAAGLLATMPNPEPSTAEAPTASASTQGKVHSKSKRALFYKKGKYKGMPADIFSHRVEGGVGPHHNILVLNAGKKTHAKKGKHEHAAAKDKGPASHHQPRGHAGAGANTHSAGRDTHPQRKTSHQSKGKAVAPPKPKATRSVAARTGGTAAPAAKTHSRAVKAAAHKPAKHRRK